MLEQFINYTIKIADVYTPDYIVPFSFLENNNIEIDNVVFLLFSRVNNKNYTEARFYYSISFCYKLSSETILKSDYCGFSPDSVFIIKTNEKNSENLINLIKSTPLYKNHYSECL